MTACVDMHVRDNALLSGTLQVAIPGSACALSLSGPGCFLIECPANPQMPVQDKMKQLRGKFAVNHPQHNKKKAPSHVKHSKHRAGVC